MKNPENKDLFTAYVMQTVLLLLLLTSCGSGKKATTLTLASENDSALLFAHRGVATEFPENSSVAIKKAKKIGYKAIEVDIQLSGDNDLIVFHDNNGKRLLGVDSNINKMQTSQIKKYPLIGKNKKHTTYVLTVDELLSKYSEGVIIYLDVKLSNLKVFDQLIKCIKSNDLTESTIIASTNIKSILYVEMRYPYIHTALEGFDAGKEWVYYVIPKWLQPDFYSGTYQNINKKHVQWLTKNDLLERRIVYGIDSTNYNEAVNAGLKNLITDYSPHTIIPKHKKRINWHK